LRERQYQNYVINTNYSQPSSIVGRSSFSRKGPWPFEGGKERETAALKRTITKLEEKIATKNEVLGELMEDHIELKKSLGEL